MSEGLPTWLYDIVNRSSIKQGFENLKSEVQFANTDPVSYSGPLNTGLDLLTHEDPFHLYPPKMSYSQLAGMPKDEQIFYRWYKANPNMMFRFTKEEIMEKIDNLLINP